MLDEGFRADEQRIASERRWALIGRIFFAGGTEGKNAPETLFSGS